VLSRIESFGLMPLALPEGGRNAVSDSGVRKLLIPMCIFTHFNSEWVILLGA
jgi:hypothetical protein